MKTNQRCNIALFPESRWRDNVVLLEELEFGMTKQQLESIQISHNEGMQVVEIAESENRNIYEVIIALLHLKRAKKLNKKLRLDSVVNSKVIKNGGFK